MPCVCTAATYTVPDFTGSSIQQTVNKAHADGANNKVYLPPGSYAISSPITLPCDNDLTITGPITTPSTAILNPSFTNALIFNLSKCTGIEIEYLRFTRTGGISVSNANASNISVDHNEFYGLPSSIGGQSIASAAIYLDGTIDTTIANFRATWNTFGDSASCTAVFSSTLDQQGYCAGIYAQPGIIVNAVIEHNVFNHVEEGVHFHQICSGCPKGSNQSVTQNARIQFNYFVNWHRIAIEMQAGVVGAAMVVSDNALGLPLNPFYGTMFISDACCTNGRQYLTSSPANPANITEDNLLYGQGMADGSFWAPCNRHRVLGRRGIEGEQQRDYGGFQLSDRLGIR